MFSKPTYLNEDKAMPVVVLSLIKKDKDHNNIYVLDRGLKALKMPLKPSTAMRRIAKD